MLTFFRVEFKKKHINMIENVQKRATKQIPGIKNVSYEERLRKLELPTSISLYITRLPDISAL
jgi:hypothetical protein